MLNVRIAVALRGMEEATRTLRVFSVLLRVMFTQAFMYSNIYQGYMSNMCRSCTSPVHFTNDMKKVNWNRLGRQMLGSVVKPDKMLTEKEQWTCLQLR